MSLKAISVLAKLNIGDRSDLEISAVVLFSLSSLKSSEPFSAGLLGSKNPVGFLKDAISSIFNIASSAINNPGANPDLGSSERPTARVFILSISTAWSLTKSDTNSFNIGS